MDIRDRRGGRGELQRREREGPLGVQGATRRAWGALAPGGAGRSSAVQGLDCACGACSAGAGAGAGAGATGLGVCRGLQGIGGIKHWIVPLSDELVDASWALGQTTTHWGRQIAYPNALLPAPMRWAAWQFLPQCAVICPDALGGLVVACPDAPLPTPMLCFLPQCAGRSGRCLPQCSVSCPNRVERRVGTADGARCYWRPAGTGYTGRSTPGRGAPPEASSVAKWTPPLPASCSACVRHEKPSARYTAPGSSSRAGNSDSPATPTDTS